MVVSLDDIEGIDVTPHFEAISLNSYLEYKLINIIFIF